MKILRSDIPVAMTVLMIVLTVLFAFIAIPFLLFVGCCWLLRGLARACSPDNYRRGKERRPGPYTPQSSSHDEKGRSAAANDETIECEIISARTFDEDGQEIR